MSKLLLQSLTPIVVPEELLSSYITDLLTLPRKQTSEVHVQTMWIIRLKKSENHQEYTLLRRE